MDILLSTEKQSRLNQLGDWQSMARRRYQKGSIRLRGKRNPVWELQWWTDYIQENGMLGRKRESKILGLRCEITKRQAQRLADEALAPLNQGKLTPFSALTLSDFVERHYKPLGLVTLKISTQKRYLITLNKHILPAFGSRKLLEITTLDLQRFVLEKMQAGLGWEAAHHLRTLTSKLYVTAKKWGHFGGENPALGVELPEKVAVRRKDILDPEQIGRLYLALPEPVRTMAEVGILSGLRVGEILGLRWSDIDFSTRLLRVEQNVYRGTVGTPKTKSSKRKLPMPETLSLALQEHRKRMEKQFEILSPDALVFQSRNRTPLNDTNLLHRFLKPAGAAIGAPWLSWHTLRRTHATLFQVAGGSLRDAQAQMGHSKASTTLELYTQPIPANQRTAVELLAQLVTNGDAFGAEAQEGSGRMQ